MISAARTTAHLVADSEVMWQTDLYMTINFTLQFTGKTPNHILCMAIKCIHLLKNNCKTFVLS